MSLVVKLPGRKSPKAHYATNVKGTIAGGPETN
jgi:hypothetical protein